MNGLAAAPPRTAAGAPEANRVTTRFTLAFALVSAAASILPLFLGRALEHAAHGFERGAALAWYALATVFFFGVVAPCEFRRDPGRSRRPWAVLFVFAGLFATLPAATAAYVSGVGAKDLAALAAAPCAVAGLALCARAAFGARAPAVFVPLFIAFAAVLPGIAVATQAFGVEPPGGRLFDASPTLYVWRLATRRPAPGATAWWCVAAAAWIAPALLRRIGAKGAAAVVAASTLAAFALAPAGDDGPLDHVRIEARAGAVARAGARTPLRLRMPRADGACAFTFAAERRLVPFDGADHDVLVTLAPDERDVELSAAGKSRRVALPCAATPPASALAAVRTRPASPAAARFAAAPPPGWAAFDAGDAASLRAADLEAFDALIVDAATYAALPAFEKDEADRFAASGGTLVLVDAAAAAATANESFEGRRVRTADPARLDAAAFRRRPADAFDATLRGLFLGPDWARVDLGKLGFFLAAYHAAFLLAFLLPWRLDGRKSSNVYLASVGFVLVAVVLGGRAALRSFFLRDNQIATQSFTALRVGAIDGRPRALLRQWRSFASMSGETRDLPLPREEDVVVYRDRARTPFTFAGDAAAPRLDDATFDRFSAMALLREDRFLPAPLAVEVERRSDALVLRLAPVPSVEDPARIRFAVAKRAWLLSPKGGAVEGRPVESGGAFEFSTAPASSPAAATAAGPTPEVRTVVARSLPPESAAARPSRLVVYAEGAARLDDASAYFNVEDRGAVLIFDLPDR